MLMCLRSLSLVAFLCIGTFSAFSEENVEKRCGYAVSDFGAKGDGQTDNTSAFQMALNKASETGGTVFVPAGKFLIAGNLNVPADVVLEGTWQGPARHKDSKGSTLLVTAGKGDRDGQPFLTMNECSGLKGIVIHYPDQRDEDPPLPYPWTIRGKGDNILISDVLLTNPYQAIDFGTYPCGRHYINRFYAQALYRGIFIDKCFDVGRIENVHLWPFWSTGGPVRRFTEREGVAFIFGRTDWQFVTNTFCIGYNVGFLFQAFRDGPGNVLISQSGSDIGPCAVRVEQVQEHAGVSFTNCQMMAGVDVLESNSGPVKFTSTGFWPIRDTESQVKLKGKGQVFFEGCHFSDWDVPGKGAPCIEANSQGLTITGCDFMASGKKQIVLGENVKSAVITASRFRGGILIENKTSGDVQVGLNTSQ